MKVARRASNPEPCLRVKQFALQAKEVTNYVPYLAITKGFPATSLKIDQPPKSVIVIFDE
jgi:hypothetical protein